jgi:hypothetical protein
MIKKNFVNITGFNTGIYIGSTNNSIIQNNTSFLNDYAKLLKKVFIFL